MPPLPSSNLIAHLKAIEQKEEITHKRSTWPEIIKLRAEINETTTQTKQYKESMRQRVGFEKINKIDKFLPKLTKKQREHQLTKLEMKGGT